MLPSLRLLLLAKCLLVFATSSSSYSSSSPLLEVYAIAHTHLDVGWLQTFDSYYYLNVSGMLPTIIQNLAQDPAKRFTWAEISYFQKWYNLDATSNEKILIKNLISTKQFEFVDGGLVQHDQACVITEDIVDQMTFGHNFLLSEFGVIPKIGWSLDPFGSSTSNAALYALMGYNALVINRIPSQKMNTLRSEQSLQFLWQASNSLSQPSTTIFTHIFDSYFCTFGPSYPFVWSWSQGDGPHIDQKNLQNISLDLAHSILPRAAWFRTNKILIPWGCDFAYQNATVPFMYSDMLFKEINSHPEIYNITIKYATPSEYFNDVYKENRTWPVRMFKEGDFFPLQYETNVGGEGKGVKKEERQWKNSTNAKQMSDLEAEGSEKRVEADVVVAQQVWSSFYTSRPSLKLASRKALSAIYAAQTMYVLTRATLGQQQQQQDVKKAVDFLTNFQILQQANFYHSIALHHDAITGTMCHPPEGCTGGDQSGGDHYVLTDYLSMQQAASDSSEKVLAVMINNLLVANTTATSDTTATATVAPPLPSLLPISQDENWGVLIQRHKQIVLVLFNPLAFDRHEIVSLSLPSASLIVKNSSGSVIPSVTLSWNTEKGYARNPERYNQHIHFPIDIPALGFVTLYLTPCVLSSSFPFNCVDGQASSSAVAGTHLSLSQYEVNAEATSDTTATPATDNVFQFQLENEYMTVYCDNVTGVLSVLEKASQRNYSLALDLRSYALQNRFDMPAYVFDPLGPSQPILKGAIVQTVLWKTAVVDQVFFQLTNDHSLTVRVYKNAGDVQGRFIELEYVIGPLDAETSAVVQISSDLKGDMLFTDMNTFEMTSRTMNASLTTPENSWPTQRSAYVRSNDNTEQLSIVCEQTHALIQETASASGQFQLMLQTRALSKDIPHDDVDVHIHKIWLALGPTLPTNRARHALQQRVQHPVRALSAEGSQSTWGQTYRTKFAPLANPLQENLQGLRLFTLAPLDGSSSRSVIRVHHDYEVAEDPVLSALFSLDFMQLFAKPITVTSITERSLTLNQNQSNMSRWVWNQDLAQNAFSDQLESPIAVNALQLRSYEIVFA